MTTTEEALERAALADPFRQYKPEPTSLVGMLVADSDLIRALVAERDEAQAKLAQAPHDGWCPIGAPTGEGDDVWTCQCWKSNVILTQPDDEAKEAVE